MRDFLLLESDEQVAFASVWGVSPSLSYQLIYLLNNISIMAKNASSKVHVYYCRVVITHYSATELNSEKAAFNKQNKTSKFKCSANYCSHS